MKALIAALFFLCILAHADEYDEAVKLIREGKFEVAETLLRAHVEKNGDSVKARYALGFCAEKQGQRQAAYDNYRTAVAINLKNGDDPETTKKVFERLFTIAPAMKPVIEKAWALEEDASRAKTREQREYLLGAARSLFEYAFEGIDTSNVASSPPAQVTNSEMEKVLGYRLGLHKVGAKKFDANGHYYMFIESNVSWHDAQERCKQMGGYLATISNQTENDFILKLCEGKYGAQAQIMIGGTDEYEEGDWKWVTGEPFRFKRFHASQPNDGKGSNILVIWKDGWWADNPAKFREHVGFVCEWNE